MSEILDWVEANRTIEAWLCTGIEQGRSPLDVASDKNLEVGRSAIKQVIKAALDQDDEAWATSLREVGFSSGLSMAFEGIVSFRRCCRAALCYSVLGLLYCCSTSY